MSAAPILIMAGGTGGHVFPGLAVAEVLRAQRRTVVWLGTHRGLEARIVPQEGIEIEWISIAGVRRRGVLAWFTAPFKTAAAIIQVLGALRRRRPAAVLGMGGFVSGPGGIAAWLTRRPLVIHEQNAVVGTTNRWLAHLADRVFEAFPGSFPRSAAARCIGNPVRGTIASVPPPRERASARPPASLRLLVLGGSQGARALNEVVPAALARLPAALRPRVRHQAGATLEAARAAYAQARIEAQIEPFITDMAAAYAEADLVVARAGALTIAELAAVGVAAILVPYPYAVDDHQTHNAAFCVERGAAVLIAEQELDPERLARELEALLTQRARLLEMSERARALARPHAAQELAAACIELAERYA
jgi:UDP-N-acetylglucosamine--N-acetylmuramyl-(pentapeptide) pyrophosphoryl-undecaprenol N-acetylglucosamine transferase